MRDNNSMPGTLLQSLRNHAISHSLFAPTSLSGAFDRLKFVQADPIRSPARAQDLILRHRVKDYRAGDLERQYPTLELEEDFLYAYGFITRDYHALLHPRKTTDLSSLERRIFEAVETVEEIHPKELEDEFGSDRITNAWGGSSKATTHALERLRHCGLLRVVRRADGIRVYQAMSQEFLPERLAPVERFSKLIMVMANIFAPVTERCLQEASGRLRWWLPEAVNTKNIITDLLKSGELEKQTVDGIDYLYPAGNLIAEEIPRQVRFLAPFDPIVWDRRRFENFWGWAYRFEAYVPAAKRVRGYYAMPLLWGDNIIGWANVGNEKGVLNIELGFIEKPPTDLKFHSELEKEIEQLKVFLTPVSK